MISAGALSFLQPSRDLLETDTVFLRSDALRSPLASSSPTFLGKQCGLSAFILNVFILQGQNQAADPEHLPRSKIYEFFRIMQGRGGRTPAIYVIHTVPRASTAASLHLQQLPYIFISFITSSTASPHFLIRSSPRGTRRMVNEAEIFDCPLVSPKSTQDF